MYSSSSLISVGKFYWLIISEEERGSDWLRERKRKWLSKRERGSDWKREREEVIEWERGNDWAREVVIEKEREEVIE